MTLTLDLAPEAERRLRGNAAACGKSVQEYLLSLTSELPEPPPLSEYDATLDLFQQWADEDAVVTREEAERDDAEWRQIEANLQSDGLSVPAPDG